MTVKKQLLWRIAYLMPLAPLVFAYQFLLPEHLDGAQVPWLTQLFIGFGALVSLMIYLNRAIFFGILRPGESFNKSLLAKTIGFGFLGFLAVNLLSDIIQRWEGTAQVANQEAVQALFEVLSPLLLYPLMAWIGPFLEELLFRGFIPRLLFPERRGLGFLVGAIAFGLYHRPTNLGSAVLYIGMGLVLSYIAYRTQSVRYSMALHVFQNHLAFVAILVLRSAGFLG